VARPERARLLGAIAIALSCGGLGIVAGRWSAQVAPTEPPTRTAALIEAVAKETRAKLAAPGDASVTSGAVQPLRRTPGAELSGAPNGDGNGGQGSGAQESGGQGNGGQTPVARARDPDDGADVGEGSAGPPPLADVRPSSNAATEAQAATIPTTPAPDGRSHQASSMESTLKERPAAPNYQALRDYVLSR
jgi:hypothetical protein